MKRRLENLYISFILFLVIAISGCKANVQFLGDIFTTLDENQTTVFNFYASKEDEEPKFSISYKIGQELSAENLPTGDDERVAGFKPGYEVAGWQFYRYTDSVETAVSDTLITETAGKISSIKISADRVDLVSVYKVSDKTPYTVKYYLEDLDLSGFTLDESYTETFHGTTFTTTNVTAKEIPGFYFDGTSFPINRKK